MRWNSRRSAARYFGHWVMGGMTIFAFLSLLGNAEGDSNDSGVADSPKILSERRTEIAEERNPNQRVWHIVRQVETTNPITKQVEAK